MKIKKFGNCTIKREGRSSIFFFYIFVQVENFFFLLSLNLDEKDIPTGFTAFVYAFFLLFVNQYKSSHLWKTAQ